jgi:hypothetical protein
LKIGITWNQERKKHGETYGNTDKKTEGQRKKKTGRKEKRKEEGETWNPTAASTKGPR